MLRFSFLALLLTALPVAAQHARPAETLIVTKTADTDDGTCDADCSLREALASANAGIDRDSVRFAPALGGETITLALGQLEVTQSVILDATGLDLTVSGGGASRVFYLDVSRVLPTVRGLVEIIGLTIADGFTEGEGGGILARGQTFLVLRESTVRDNRAASGGGISVSALSLRRSTVANNVATSGGGGVYTTYASISNSTISGNRAEFGGGLRTSPFTTSVITVQNSTIIDNRATVESGGIHSFVSIWDDFSEVSLENSIVAGNRVARSLTAPSANCGGLNSPPFSRGYNVLGSGCSSQGTDRIVSASDAAALDFALADNGGPTLTHALRAPGGDPARNPAIDIGGTCGPADQRGFEAPVDGDGDGIAACDAGAVEFASGAATQPALDATSTAPSSFALDAAYPNPFRTATTLALDLPEARTVTLTVYDVLGRAVRTLAEGELEAGRHAVAFDGAGLPSGVYVVRMEADAFTATQRVTLVR